MELLTRAFYAQQDTKSPVLIGTAAMTLNVLFSFAFAGFFARAGFLPHGGLALANSFATALEAAALYLVMRRRLNGIHGPRIARGLAVSGRRRCVSAGLLGDASCGDLTRWISVPVGVVLGVLVYFLGLWLLKVPEMKQIAGALIRRLKPAHNPVQK
jgi:putative peptidoglycan lipid II flippase